MKRWVDMLYKRMALNQFKETLNTSGAVYVSGPKFCGKTTICKELAESEIQLIDDRLISLVNTDPSIALKGETPRLIDEWQVCPNLWNLVRAEVDKNKKFGQYILTGSSTPTETKTIHHSGAGRISRMKLRTLSLYESLDSTGQVSISECLKDKQKYPDFIEQNSTLADIAYYICRGGWPLSVLASNRKNVRIKSSDSEIKKSLRVTKNYFSNLFDLKNSENETYRKKNTQTLQRIIKSYSRNISSEAAINTILNDCINNTGNLDIKTLNTYLQILEDLFIIEEMPAWCPNIRSKAAIRTTNTRHFTDTSTAAYALGISPDNLLKDADTFGLFFEDMAVRDLRIYADTFDAKVYHYRDSNGLECDSIIKCHDGTWAAVEIKLGGPKLTDDGAASLLKLKDIIVEDKKPSLLMVLTAVGPAYTRPDGVVVSPITMLKN